MPSRRSKKTNWLSLILPFAAGVAVVAIGAGIYFLVREIASDDGSSPQSPTPTPGPYPVLAEGEYIDSLPTDIHTVSIGLSAVPMTYAASQAGAIAMIELTELVETIVPTPEPGTITPSGEPERATPWTIYRATVKQWIKGGNGESEIRISEIGGEDIDGARLFTGTFLGQVGRTYITILDPPNENSPGYPNIDYIGVFAGWSTFEIGDGVIHVLNQKTARELMGAWNLTPVEEFIGQLEDWIIEPPAVTPTSPPSPSRTPAESSATSAP